MFASFVTAALLEATSLRTTLVVLGVGFAVVSILGIRPLVAADRRSASALAELQPKIALLQELDLFAELPRTALEELARSLDEVEAQPGEVQAGHHVPAPLRPPGGDAVEQVDAREPHDVTRAHQL